MALGWKEDTQYKQKKYHVLIPRDYEDLSLRLERCPIDKPLSGGRRLEIMCKKLRCEKKTF